MFSKLTEKTKIPGLLINPNLFSLSKQLANIAVGGTNERRYFTGVDGESGSKGELFGSENLFSYRSEGANLAKDIIKRTEKVEAGFRVAKYVPPSESEEGASYSEKASPEHSVIAKESHI